MGAGNKKATRMQHLHHIGAQLKITGPENIDLSTTLYIFVTSFRNVSWTTVGKRSWIFLESLSFVCGHVLNSKQATECEITLVAGLFVYSKPVSVTPWTWSELQCFWSHTGVWQLRWTMAWHAYQPWAAGPGDKGQFQVIQCRMNDDASSW